MKSYKEPSFQDRARNAAEAKKKALDRLKSKAPVDEKIVAERAAARLKRDAAEAAKRAARKASDQAADAAKADLAAIKEGDVTAAPTEAERKAARDARYAARKRRK